MIVVALIRLSVSMGASLAGVLATAILWKPGVVVGALLVPVITVFVDHALGEPLLRAVRRAPAGGHRGGLSHIRAALVVGLIGFLIVGAALTVPKLLGGDPLRSTPLFGGQVPLVDAGGDRDGDGFADANDNCPGVVNPGQEDTNGAGRGDACDPDDDNDTVLDDEDNCRTVPNPGQENTNGAGRGDACDPDDDNDTVLDDEDNCRTVPNSEQEDADGDEIGDACDDLAEPGGETDVPDDEGAEVPQDPVDGAG